MRFKALNDRRRYAGRGGRLYACLMQAVISWLTSQSGVSLLVALFRLDVHLMQTLFSWLTSQSFVSLLVALIALGGVLINNQAAEKRRQADQEAADQRRKRDQAAEDDRRKADDRRRERERLEQLERNEQARQRQAVANCVKAIFLEMQNASSEILQFQLNDRTQDDQLVHEKWMTMLERFYWSATMHLNICDLEITEELVADCVGEVWKAVKEEKETYNEVVEARNLGQHGWRPLVASLNPAIGPIMVKLRELTQVAQAQLNLNLEQERFLEINKNEKDNDK